MTSGWTRWVQSALVLCLMICTPALSHAQFSSNVQGTVTDAKGRVVAGASVVLRNTDTGAENMIATNNSGFYRFTSIAPGPYTVEVSSAGFAKLSTAVTVEPEATRGLDLTLSVAQANSTVVVTSIASALNPEETRVQTTISASEISKLPLANRDVQELIALTPGVTGYQNESASLGYGSSIFAGYFNPRTTATARALGEISSWSTTFR